MAVSVVPLVIGVVLLGIGGGLSWFAWTSGRTWRTIRGLDVQPIFTLGGGLAEVEGKVVARELALEAPVSGTRCVHYRFKVEERRTRTVRTKNGTRTETYWHTVVNDTRSVPFLLDDGTAKVEVDVSDASLILDEDGGGGSGLFRDPTPEFEAALKRYGESHQGFLIPLNRNLRWRETLVAEGDRLYVLGTYEGKRMVKGADGLFVVSDKGEAGVLSRFRWRTIGGGLGAVALIAVAAVLLYVGVGA